MTANTHNPLDGGATVIFVIVGLFALLCVLNLSGVETDIRPLDTVVETFLKTIGAKLSTG